MGVFVKGGREIGDVGAVEFGGAAGAFAGLPAVVAAAGCSGGLIVDLFAVAVADVADEEVAGGAVEGESPGVAEACGPDFGQGAFGFGVGGWDGVGGDAGLGIDAEDFTEEGVGALGGVERVGEEFVAGPGFEAAVAGGDVHEAVDGAEGDHAAVVLAEGLGDGEDDGFCVGIGYVGIFGEVEAGDGDGFILGDVIGVEVLLFGEIWGECDAEEAEFSAVLDFGFDIEEGGGEELAAGEDLDDAFLFDDEEAVRAVVCGGGVGGLTELGEEFFPANGGLRGENRREQKQEGECRVHTLF